MSSPGDNPPPSSSFRNSYSPLAPPGQSNPSSRSSTPGPARPPVPNYIRAQSTLHSIAEAILLGNFKATPNPELARLRQEITYLTLAWDGQFPVFPTTIQPPPPPSEAPMIIEPIDAPPPDPPAPAPVSQTGPPLSYATAAASVASSQPSRTPQPQGKKAPASTPAGKSKKRNWS